MVPVGNSTTNNTCNVVISPQPNTFYKFKLIYFEDRGKADLIKLMLHLGKQTYEEIQIKQTEWNYYRSFMPFEQVPVLILNDEHKIAQMNTICRFLANRFQLSGKTEIESITCDMIVEQLRECGDHALQAMNETDHAKRIQLTNRFLNETLVQTLVGYEKMLSQNSTKYIVGDGLTWADLALVNGWEWLDHASRKIMANYPLVRSHESFIRTIPEVADWLKKQKPLTVLKKV